MRSGGRAEPSHPRPRPQIRIDGRRAGVARRPRASHVRARRATPHGARLLGMSKGPASRPVGWAADEPTAEDIRSDVSVRCAQDLGSGSSGRPRPRPRPSRVQPSKRLIGEHTERAKRRVVPTERGHAAICKVRGLT